MPNGLGGFGLPRYIKQSSGYNPEDYYGNGEWSADAQLTVDPATGAHSLADQELSPNASEYKPTSS